MIKFEFTLDDVDAQNFISILRDEVVRMRAFSLDYTGIPGHSAWYLKHADYLEQMIEKILAGNHRV